VKDVFTKALKILIGDDVSLSSFAVSKKRPLKELTERDLILLESKIGATIFGPVAPGGRREFFNEDPKNWIWYEEWTGADKKQHSTTTRYEVHAEGILKVREGDPYHFIEGQELQNLLVAVQMYRERVMRDIYKRDPQTGKLIN
jgi:hypothetical protein